MRTKIFLYHMVTFFSLSSVQRKTLRGIIDTHQGYRVERRSSRREIPYEEKSDA